MAGDFLIHNARLALAGGAGHTGWLLARAGRIAETGAGAPPLAVLQAAGQTEDMQGRWVFPALVDLQVNGAAGVMFSTVTETGEVARALLALAGTGVGACLPTVFTHPHGQLQRALEVLGEVVKNPPAGGAVPLGIHLEGPFLNPAKAGCHPRAHLLAPSVAAFERFQELAGGGIRQLTLAPELPGAMALIRHASAQGVLVCAGHTLAGPEVLRQAMDHGLGAVTHLYNAMLPLQGREPGTVGAALALADLKATLIADGAHVHPAALAAAFRAKGPGHLALVSDAMPPLTPEGWAEPPPPATFDLSGRQATARDGACFYDDGTLAGSNTPLWQGLKNMAQALKSPWLAAEANQPVAPADLLAVLPMASITPARWLGEENRYGVLAPGAVAQWMVVNDAGCIERVWMGGMDL